MAKLDINRMINQTKLKSVDNAHNQLEEDLATILGVPDGQVITASIFGVNPENDTPGDASKPVQADGSIKGIISFLLAAATADAADSVGLEFDDGTEIKRLCLVDSEIRIYKWDDPSWVLVTNLEIPGSMTFQGLHDTSVTLSIGEADKLVAIDSEGSYYVHVAAPAGTGETTFEGLTDTPVGMGIAGQRVGCDGAALIFENLPAALSTFGVWIVSGTTTVNSGETNSIDSWSAQTIIGGWDDPTIVGGTTIAIPYEGFYHISMRIKGNPHELTGLHSAYVYGSGITGPASSQRWLGGHPIYDHAWNPAPNKANLYGPLMNGVFAANGATTVTVKLDYTAAPGGPASLKAIYDAAIVRIG